MHQLETSTTARSDHGTGDLAGPTPLTDADMWARLVEEHQDRLLRIAWSYRIGHDAHDVVQSAWLRLLEQGDSIRNWDAVVGWLTTVVRRECLRVIRLRQRERLYDPEDLGQVADVADNGPTADEILVREESQQLVRQAMRSLPPRQHDLLVALSDADAPEYSVVGARLGMPVGSMGPTRQRGLRRLRATLVDLGLEMAS
jgi:RNA polymerase sigma factor (sigma-70 family)